MPARIQVAICDIISGARQWGRRVTIVGGGTQVLEDEAAMQEECVVGVGAECGVQGRGGVERSLGSGLKCSVCTCG